MSNVKEKLREYLKENWPDGSIDSELDDILSICREDGWVSVIERLPIEFDFLPGQNGDILLQLSDQTVIMGMYSVEDNKFTAYWQEGLGEIPKPLRVIKWKHLPLPTPPTK